MRRSTGRSTGDRAAMMVARTTIEKTDDDPKMQTVGLKALHGERLDDVEHVHPYGFSAHPKAPSEEGKAEAVVVFPGGNRSHALAIVSGDRRYRLNKLAEGEVALHDDQGQKVHIQRGGVLVETSKQVTSKVGAGTIVQTSDTVTVSIGGVVFTIGGGKITANCDIVTTGDVIANGISLQHHVNTGVTPGGATTGPPA